MNNLQVKEHIELVKKWLADPESVSQEERKANYSEAHAANAAHHKAYTAYAASAARAAFYDNVPAADHWVRRYEEFIK